MHKIKKVTISIPSTVVKTPLGYHVWLLRYCPKTFLYNYLTNCRLVLLVYYSASINKVPYLFYLLYYWAIQILSVRVFGHPDSAAAAVGVWLGSWLCPGMYKYTLIVCEHLPGPDIC